MRDDKPCWKCTPHDKFMAYWNAKEKEQQERNVILFWLFVTALPIAGILLTLEQFGIIK